MNGPSATQSVQAARVAREAGRLRTALRALDHAYAGLPHEPGAREALAAEAGEVARALERQGALIAALGELLRARDLGSRDAADGVARLTEAYPRWRPATASIGVPRDALTAGASGAFWIAPGRRGRVITLLGGLTGEGTEAFTRILELCAEGVDWLFVDMSQLNYVGSAGLAVAVKVAERLKAQGGGASLFALSSNLKLLVETLGLSTFLNPSSDLQHALDLARQAR